MRVISGKAKGRKLLSVPGDSTRPILDRVKTAVFDIIRPELEDTVWLDLFGGSGAVGIEALSQGAKHCTFIDLNKNAVETIKKNIAHTELEDQAEVRSADAFSFLRNTQRSFDIIYIAPPQYQNLWVDAVHHVAERPERINPEGQIIVQIDPKEYELLSLSSFSLQKEKRYGNTLLLFYKKTPAKH